VKQDSPSTIRIAAVASLERLINFALRYDPGTQLALKSLHGQVFALQCIDPHFTLYLHVDEPIRLTELHEGTITTRIEGTLKDFAGLALADDPASALINSDISVHGKSGPLIELQGVLKQLDIDWEEPLADFVGDVAAHQIGIGVRKSVRVAKVLPEKLQTRVKHHLVEEAKLLPNRAEVEAWMNDVAKLNIDIERLRAKMAQLKQRRQQG
jgi:ubiquinone biosynthesis protein UbiJ